MDARFFQRSYDRFAAQYDAVFEDQQRPKIQGLLAAIDQQAAPRLDAGCGTGLATRISGLPFVGLDASGAMLRQATGHGGGGLAGRAYFDSGAALGKM